MEPHGLVCPKLLPQRRCSTIHTGTNSGERDLGWGDRFADPWPPQWSLLCLFSSLVHMLQGEVVGHVRLYLLLRHVRFDVEILGVLSSDSTVQDDLAGAAVGGMGEVVEVLEVQGRSARYGISESEWSDGPAGMPLINRQNGRWYFLHQRPLANQWNSHQNNLCLRIKSY